MDNLYAWTTMAVVILVTDALLIWLGYQFFRKAAPKDTAAPSPRPVQPVEPKVDLNRLEEDFATLREAMDGLDGCLATVNGAIHRRANSARPETDTGKQTYAIAHNLARKGASVAELMADCGLSRGEAQLIFNINGAAAPRVH